MACSNLSHIWLQRRSALWQATSVSPPLDGRCTQPTKVLSFLQRMEPAKSKQYYQQLESIDMPLQLRSHPIQTEAVCPLHTESQPILEASVVTTTSLDTCSRGTLAICPYAPWATEIVLEELLFFPWMNSGRCSFVRHADMLTEPSSISKKEMLCTWESSFFSQLTQNPN